MSENANIKNKIFNWLLINNENLANTFSTNFSNKDSIIQSEFKNNNSNFKITKLENKTKINKRLNKKSLSALQKLKKNEVEEKELIRSPVSGTYIIKDWNKSNKSTEKTSNKEKCTLSQGLFTKNEITLNSIAASFVEITPQSKARLAKIPNKIGPYECKLCKVVYKDAFELAMHNCPRVVHIEYSCSECGKVFNCPANLASHKRWHKPKKTITGEDEIDKANSLEENKFNNVFKTPNLNKTNNEFIKAKINGSGKNDSIKTFEEFKQDDMQVHSKNNNNNQEYLSEQQSSNYWMNSVQMNNPSLIYDQFLLQHYSEAVVNNRNSSTSFLNSSPSFNLNLNQNYKIQNDWLSHVYSNYFSMATQSLLSGISIGLPVHPLPTETLVNSSNKSVNDYASIFYQNY